MSNLVENLFTECIVLDTETTSIDFKVAEIIQYAGDNVMNILEKMAAEDFKNAVPSYFFKPELPITPKISAVTSITNRMVANAPAFNDHREEIEAKINSHQYMVAHNSYYDEGVFRTHGMKYPKSICTMRFAKKLYVDDEHVDEFNLSFLRYALDLPIPDDIPAHLADADVMVTALLFVREVEDAIDRGHLDVSLGAATLGEQIVDWLDKPIIIEKMAFGKHKGKKLTEVPLDYWQWAIDNMNGLNEEDPAYDRDFAASVTKAIEEILEGQS